MTPFEVYLAYIGLQRHFKVDTYDYFRYNGKVNAKQSTFEKRNDRYAFMKLAKEPDPQSVILANLVDGSSDYIGDIASTKGQDIYMAWLKRHQAMSYLFKSDLHEIDGSFVGAIRSSNGQHPSLLKLYARETICIETLIILDDLCSFFGRWNETISDPVYWPSVYTKCLKYRGFLDYDKSKMKSILLNRFVSKD